MQRNKCDGIKSFMTVMSPHTGMQQSGEILVQESGMGIFKPVKHIFDGGPEPDGRTSLVKRRGPVNTE
jgi:hypothetical protein